MARPGPPCALDSALIDRVTWERGEGVPASWASAPFSTQCDWGARAWEIRWAMLSQRSYPDTPTGLRVHRSRMAGVSSPCDSETPAGTVTPSPCPHAHPPSSEQNGLLSQKARVSIRRSVLGRLGKESPAAPLPPFPSSLPSHSSALGPPVPEGTLRATARSGVTVLVFFFLAYFTL